MGALIEPVPFTGLAANFSPVSRIVPAPFGGLIDGGELARDYNLFPTFLFDSA
jgi:hypothetical protein